jgi:hypothetical protein
MTIKYITPPRARGIGRVSDNENAVILYFDRKLTDDEMRAVHHLSDGNTVVALSVDEVVH